MASGGAGDGLNYIKPFRKDNPVFYAEGEDVQEVLDFLKMVGEDLTLQYRESARDTYNSDKIPGQELNDLLAADIQADQGYNLAITEGDSGYMHVSGTITEELPSTPAQRELGATAVEEGIEFDGFTDRSAEELYREARNVGLKDARLTKKADRAWRTVFGVR